MQIFALILAKSKSKRLPGKNLLPFKGEPMFLMNVKKCLRIFDKVFVSSDSEWILDMAEREGAIGIKRGQELCGDVPDIPVFQHALGHMGPVEAIVAVHANNPTIGSNLIAVTKKMLEMGVPEVMTCHPVENEYQGYKEQNAKIYGSIRGMTTDRLITYPDPYEPKPEVLLVDCSIEIETQEDFDRASK